MIVTARQLDDLHKRSGSNGHVTLPYRARLSPLAADWVRQKKVVLGYSDGDAQPTNGSAPTPPAGRPASAGTPHATASPTGTTIGWCDGPCGPAKAAITAQAKESSLHPLDLPPDPRQVVPVVKSVASEIKAGRAQAAVLLVQSGAAAMVYANRCPSLRAVLGTCMESVEQGVQQVAANVLVIEHPHRTLQQVKNVVGRFVRARRALPEDVRRQHEERASCG